MRKNPSDLTNDTSNKQTTFFLTLSGASKKGSRKG